MAVFAGARTQDLMGLSIRLAGFEIRDTLGWIFGSGFPKGQDLGKIIDKKLGAQREVVGSKIGLPGYSLADSKGANVYGGGFGGSGDPVKESEITSPATPEAKQWTGWNSQLKPAIEPIILARKPLDGTVANNVLAHGVGGLNIDACRVSHNEPEDHTKRVSPKLSGVYGDGTARAESDSLRSPAPAGRFPANVLLDEHAAKEMDKQSGPAGAHGESRGGGTRGVLGWQSDNRQTANVGDGGASRFFPVFKYQAKAPKKERPVIEREAVYGLRDDLTEDQVDYVLARLREAGVETG